MKTPLSDIEILSVYMKSNHRLLLPPRMAKCTPDTHAALVAISRDVEKAGGKLFLSDLFRSYDMQFQSHLDWKTGKKKAFSPPPGGSLHEAGRAFDLDLGSLKMTLKKFWPLAKAHGVFPIIKQPDSAASEAWHFDCRGSHNLVYDYYSAGKGTNMKPYEAMAASAVLSIGVQVDRFGSKQREAAIQSCVVRLGKDIGNIDGAIGARTEAALAKLGVPFKDLDETLRLLENKVQKAFPREYRTGAPAGSETGVPEHLIR